MSAGRPLRFLAAILAVWIGWRTAWFRPMAAGRVPMAAASQREVDEAMRGYRAFAERYPIMPPWIDFPPSDRVADWPVLPMHPVRARTSRATGTATPRPTVFAQPGVMREAPASPPAQAEPVQAVPERAPVAGLSLPPAPQAASAGRWAGSGWAILRGGGGAFAGGRDFAGGRLGAAQAGMRVTYALGAARRLALAARVSSPLEGRGREAGLGIDWRPTRLPVHLLAEQRIGPDRDAPSGPALSMIGGIDAMPVAAGFRLHGYGQAGIARIGGFVDGSVRLARPVAQAAGWRLDLGVGAWGGAQPGAARLDLGPSAGLVVPIAGRSLRLTLDWRARVAGGAAPGSGPALSIGHDF